MAIDSRPQTLKFGRTHRHGSRLTAANLEGGDDAHVIWQFASPDSCQHTRFRQCSYHNSPSGELDNRDGLRQNRNDGPTTEDSNAFYTRRPGLRVTGPAPPSGRWYALAPSFLLGGRTRGALSQECSHRSVTRSAVDPHTNIIGVAHLTSLQWWPT